MVRKQSSERSLSNEIIFAQFCAWKPRSSRRPSRDGSMVEADSEDDILNWNSLVFGAVKS